MTDREQKLTIGLLAKVYTNTFDTSKSLDEQCEDLISLGEKISIGFKDNNLQEDNTIKQKIKTCECEIENLKYQMHLNNILSLLPTHVMPFYTII